MGASFNDTLYIAGLEGQALFDLYQEFVETKENPLSSQFVAFLLYNFSKAGFLNTTTWAKL
jgi:DNA-binding protein Fis